MRLARPAAALLLLSFFALPLLAPAASADLRVMAYCDGGLVDDCGVSAKDNTNACMPLVVAGPCAYTDGGKGVGVWVFTPVSPWCSSAPDDCTGVNPVSTCGHYDLVEAPGNNVGQPTTAACMPCKVRCLIHFSPFLQNLGCRLSNPCLQDMLP